MTLSPSLIPNNLMSLGRASDNPANKSRLVAFWPFISQVWVKPIMVFMLRNSFLPVTKAPMPWRLVRISSSTNNSSALRTVMRLMLYALLNSISVMSCSFSFSSPAAIWSLILSANCWYSGIPASRFSGVLIALLLSFDFCFAHR